MNKLALIVAAILVLPAAFAASSGGGGGGGGGGCGAHRLLVSNSEPVVFFADEGEHTLSVLACAEAENSCTVFIDGVLEEFVVDETNHTIGAYTVNLDSVAFNQCENPQECEVVGFDRATFSVRHCSSSPEVPEFDLFGMALIGILGAAVVAIKKA